MKKTIAVLLVVFLLLTAFSIVGGAFSGSGVAVVADGVSVIKTGLVGKKLTFTDADFKCAFSLADFKKIEIKTLPSSTEGTLMLAGRRVREGQEIRRRAIAAMVFVPASREVSESEFIFTLDGGEECVCKMRFTEKINYAPEIEESTGTGLYVTTQREVAVYGEILASDKEGDSLEYLVVSYPKRGSVIINPDGEYKYTPSNEYTGYDSFVYVVRDEYGNYSEAREVDIKVIERMSEIVYRDMVDEKEYNAAISMNALGVMSGRQVGSDYYFDKDTGVTRAEFVAMALKARGIRPVGASTYFDDDESIPVSLKGYVGKAHALGIIDGEYKNSRLNFSPNEPITMYEAADILARMLNITPSSESEYSEYGDVPVFVRGSLDAMVTLGIIAKDPSTYTSPLTRGSVATMLYAMVNNC